MWSLGYCREQNAIHVDLLDFECQKNLRIALSEGPSYITIFVHKDREEVDIMAREFLKAIKDRK